MIKNKKLYELKLKEKRDGVYAISLVDDPAIESNFLLFNKEEPIIFSENEEQKIITGPALIPDKKILRKYKNEFFDVVLNKQTIKDTAVKFFKENNQTNTTLQHKEKIDNNDTVFFESWIIENFEKDKANYLGFKDLPNGTWMVSLKIQNDELWEKIKNGNFNGFSIEAFFSNEEIKEDKKNEKNMFKKLIENLKNTITNFEIESIKFEDVKLKDGSIFRIDETGKVSIINEDGTLTDAKDGDYILEDDSILTVKGGIKTEMKEEIKTEMAETILKDGDYILEDGTKFSIKDSKIIMIEKEIVNEEPIEEFSNVSEIEIELNKEKENFEKIKVDFEAEKNTLLSEITDLKSKILELEKAPAISRTEIVNNNEKSFDEMSITERTIYNIKKMK